MEMEMESYYRRYGHLQLKDFSKSNSIPPLPTNPNFQPSSFSSKQSPTPIILRKKRKFTPASSSGVKVISRAASVRKPSSAVAKKPRKSSSWVKTKLLGKGGYGSVYLATAKEGRYKTERAIKTAELSRASSLMDERRILQRLQSPFVIYCYGDEIVRQGTDQCYNLILEYCSGRCLADVIDGGLSEFDVKLFTTDVLSGLTYIHERNIIHCDIKPDNLLLCPVTRRFKPNGFLTKIADFGLAIEKGSPEYGDGCGLMRGTTRYMAPELIGSGVVDFGVDVWALGCSILEMLTGQPVWGKYGDLAFDDWVELIGYTDLIPDIPSWLSEEAQDFLQNCLVKEPDSRWGIDALMNHPFLTSYAVDSNDNGFVFD